MSAWANYNATGPPGDSGKGPSDKGRGKGRWKGQTLAAITYDGMTLEQCRKDIYDPHPKVRYFQQQDIELLRYQHNIEVDLNHPGCPPPIAPVDTLDISTFPDETTDSLREDMKILQPTPIQMQVWPAAMSGRDIIGVAPTGSGKTLAYLLPIFEHCKVQTSRARERNDRCGPMALILVPNQDLARQISRWFDKSRRASRPLTMASMVPREPFPRTGTYDILVASPGKLIQFLNQECEDRHAYFRRTTFVVVDEADHLLGKNERDGEQHTTDILRQLRPDIQMLYFTATWDDALPFNILEICSTHNTQRAVTREPLLNIVVNGKTLSACKNVDQFFLRRNSGYSDDYPSEDQRRRSEILNRFWGEDDTKNDALHKLLYGILKQDPATKENLGNSKILVFTNSKEKAKELTDMLWEEGHPVAGLTGDTYHSSRNDIVKDFADPNKTNQMILVTTDLLGRGIDFTTCKWVIVYEFPHHSNGLREYVHRIGRTGRAGRQGIAITLLEENEGDLRHCRDIIKVLQASGQRVPKWMEEESSGPRARMHRQTYQRRRDEETRAQEPEVWETLPVTTAAEVPQQPHPMVRPYGHCLREADLDLPLNPFLDLDDLRQIRDAPPMGRVEPERPMPLVF